MLNIPRLDLLVGSASVSLEPASEQELSQLKIWLIALSLIWGSSLFFTLLHVFFGESTVVFLVVMPLITFVAGLLVARLICAFGNVTTISPLRHTQLQEFVSDGYMPVAGLEFISRVSATGRSLSEGEAISLIALAKKHKGKVQTCELGKRADTRLRGEDS